MDMVTKKGGDQNSQRRLDSGKGEEKMDIFNGNIASVFCIAHVLHVFTV